MSGTEVNNTGAEKNVYFIGNISRENQKISLNNVESRLARDHNVKVVFTIIIFNTNEHYIKKHYGKFENVRNSL